MDEAYLSTYANPPPPPMEYLKSIKWFSNLSQDADNILRRGCQKYFLIIAAAVVDVDVAVAFKFFCYNLGSCGEGDVWDIE